MKRFFAEIKGGFAELSPEDSNHAANVLRMERGAQITVCDGRGTDYTCEITAISKQAVTARVISQALCPAEPAVRVTLFQGLPKFDKFELIIQKCVELGVCEVVPVITERTITKPHGKEAAKVARWQKIAESAAKQAGRGIIPNIRNIMSFSQSLDSAANFDLKICAYENERELPLKTFLQSRQSPTADSASIALFIGTEGGFSEKEAAVLANAGVTCVSLGKRILRTETAGFAALAAIMYEFGEM